MEEVIVSEEISLNSNENVMCRICLMLEKNNDEYITPCGCKGTMKYVHRKCLKTWRYRGKKLEEIKRCEQCMQPYKLDDEILPHGIIVKITSSLLLVLFFAFSHFLVNLLFETVAFISLDFTTFDSYQFKVYKMNKHPEINDLNDFNSFFLPAYEEIQSIKIGLGGTTIVIALIFQIIERKNLIYVLNYIFTLWRVVKFGFFLDKILIWSLNVHQFYFIVRDLNRFTDNILVFILNYS